MQLVWVCPDGVNPEGVLEQRCVGIAVNLLGKCTFPHGKGQVGQLESLQFVAARRCAARGKRSSLRGMRRESGRQG